MCLHVFDFHARILSKIVTCLKQKRFLATFYKGCQCSKCLKRSFQIHLLAKTAVKLIAKMQQNWLGWPWLGWAGWAGCLLGCLPAGLAAGLSAGLGLGWLGLAVCLAWLGWAVCFAALCYALLCYALLLLCYALLCFAVLCFNRGRAGVIRLSLGF